MQLREPARIAELTRRATAAQAAISVAKDCCRLRSPPWRRLPSRDLLRISVIGSGSFLIQPAGTGANGGKLVRWRCSACNALFSDLTPQALRQAPPAQSDQHVP
jgi:hypothetical protein